MPALVSVPHLPSDTEPFSNRDPLTGPNFGTEWWLRSFFQEKKTEGLTITRLSLYKATPSISALNLTCIPPTRLCRVCGPNANRLYKIGRKEALVQIQCLPLLVSTLAFLVSESGQPSQWYLSAPLHYSFAVWSNPVLALAHTEPTNSPTVLCPTVIHYSNYSYLYWRPVPDQNVQPLKSDPHLTQIWF